MDFLLRAEVKDPNVNKLALMEVEILVMERLPRKRTVARLQRTAGTKSTYK